MRSDVSASMMRRPGRRHMASWRCRVRRKVVGGACATGKRCWQKINPLVCMIKINEINSQYVPYFSVKKICKFLEGKSGK